MSRFLLCVIRFQILTVGFTISIKNIRNSISHNFSKNMYTSGSGISWSFTFVILSIVSQLKAGALK